MAKRKRVLFVCVHNSARSQMAEAFLEQMAGDRFEAESAGLQPGKLNPLVLDVMQERGIDISGKGTDSVSDFLNQGRRYDYVITVCDEAQKEQCPGFPGEAEKDHWGFADPSAFEGSRAEKLEKVRQVRDAIQARLREWLMRVG